MNFARVTLVCRMMWEMRKIGLNYVPQEHADGKLTILNV